MKKTPLVALSAALMLAASPAAFAQQADQPGRQNQQQAQNEQMREIEVGDLLDREVVDQHGEQVGTISAVVRRGDGQEFFEIQRAEADRIDLLPLGPVILLDEKVVVQVEDDEIEGAQEQTEEREKRFEAVQNEEEVQVGQQLLDQGQEDQQREAEQGQQPSQQQDWQRQQGENRFARQDRQLGQQQDRLEDALRQAGFSQIERIDRNVVEARSPDGSTVFLHVHRSDTQTRGQQRDRRSWRDHGRRSGERHGWRRGFEQQDRQSRNYEESFDRQGLQPWRDREPAYRQDLQPWRDREEAAQQQDRQRWQDRDTSGQWDEQRWSDEQRMNRQSWDDRRPWTSRQ